MNQYPTKCNSCNHPPALGRYFSKVSIDIPSPDLSYKWTAAQVDLRSENEEDGDEEEEVKEGSVENAAEDFEMEVELQQQQQHATPAQPPSVPIRPCRQKQMRALKTRMEEGEPVPIRNHEYVTRRINKAGSAAYGDVTSKGMEPVAKERKRGRPKRATPQASSPTRGSETDGVEAGELSLYPTSARKARRVGDDEDYGHRA